MSVFPVNVKGEVISVIVTFVSDEATTFNPDIVPPASNVPNEPAFVVHAGPCDIVKVCYVNTALPSGFSI